MCNAADEPCPLLYDSVRGYTNGTLQQVHRYVCGGTDNRHVCGEKGEIGQHTGGQTGLSDGQSQVDRHVRWKTGETGR